MLKYLKNHSVIESESSPSGAKAEKRLTTRRLWTLLDQTVFAITRLRELELAQFGLTLPQSSILHGIVEHGGAWTLQGLEKNRMRQHHSISTLVNRMVKIGLVEKARAPSGKRYLITISREGKRIFDRQTVASLTLSFSGLSAAEKVKLASCLVVMLEKARFLLGMSETTPLLRYLSRPARGQATQKIEFTKPLGDYNLWVLLDRVGFAISRLLEIELTQYGLTLPQFTILSCLQENPGVITIQDLEYSTMRQPK